jgi:hypothetical protein
MPGPLTPASVLRRDAVKARERSRNPPPGNAAEGSMQKIPLPICPAAERREWESPPDYAFLSLTQWTPLGFGLRKGRLTNVPARVIERAAEWSSMIPFSVASRGRPRPWKTSLRVACAGDAPVPRVDRACARTAKRLRWAMMVIARSAFHDRIGVFDPRIDAAQPDVRLRRYAAKRDAWPIEIESAQLGRVPRGRPGSRRTEERGARPARAPR